MLNERFPQEPLPEDVPPPEGAVPDEPVEARGIRWIIVPALVAALVGAVIGMLHVANLRAVAGAPPQPAVPIGAVTGAIVGTIVGGVFGLIVWVAFPYKNRNPHSAPREPGEEDRGAE
ncbi:MAG: hypothetical protein L0Z62_39045 [Gemmataceae bacterium]|nr:hypothetical protein [Gemmataceae bacterium]